MMNPDSTQEFKRLSRRLLDEGAYLAPFNKEYGVMVKRNKWTKPVMRVERKHIKDFVYADLISPQKKGCYHITETGKYFCRRKQNPDDPYRHQHQSIEIDAEGIIRNVTETPLSWLKARKGRGGVQFTSEEFSAGEKLRKDYEIGQLNQRMNVDWSRPNVQETCRFGYDDLHLTDHVLDAREAFRKALEEVGTDLCDILIMVCCELSSLEMIEKKMGWPRRSGKLVLKIALSRLSHYYRLRGTSRASASERMRIAIE